jgi:hypothetical protein
MTNSYLFEDLEKEAKLRAEALEHARLTAPPPDARGWQLRAVGPTPELEEGWNEPFPPKREWVVFHFYAGRRSLCLDYAYATALPPKPHFQVDDGLTANYRDIHPDWLCKVCDVHQRSRVIPEPSVGETRVINVLWREPYQVYVGRELRRYKLPASKWASPGKNVRRKDPATALRDYKDYVLTTPELAGSLHELRGKVIACCCKGKDRDVPCYGDVLAELSAGP